MVLEDKQHFTCLHCQWGINRGLYVEQATEAAGNKASLCTCCVQAHWQILFMENTNNSHVMGNSHLSGHTDKLPLLQKSKHKHIIQQQSTVERVIFFDH